MKILFLKKLIALSLFVFMCKVSFAQNWRSTLYPSNWTAPSNKNYSTDAIIQDFSYTGYHMGEIAIPVSQTNVIDVTKAPYSADKTGAVDASAKIQSAIDKAQTDGGGVVYLPKGTYKVSAGTRNYCLLISKSNVVIRGDGTSSTFIFNNDNSMNGKAIIKVTGSGSSWKSQPSSQAKITKDLLGPTLDIPVDKPELFKVGDHVIVRNVITSAWANEMGEPEWASASYLNSLSGILHYRIIKKINATTKTITIDAPTRYALKTRDDSKVYLVGTQMIEEVGLEGFSLGNREVVTSASDWTEPGSTTDLDNVAEGNPNRGAYKCDYSWAITIDKTLNSWVKNVSTYQPSVNVYKTQILSNGILLNESRGITVDNVYMGYAQYGGGGGNGYGYRIQCNDCLIKNSTSDFMRHGFVYAFMYSHGNVMHKTTCRNSGKCTGNSANGLKTGSSGSDFHMWFSPSNLIDQMNFDNSYYSAVHRKGVANDHNAVTAHSVFWNCVGNNSPNGYCIRTSQTDYGYIMGTSGNTPTVNFKVSDVKNFSNPSVTGSSPAFTYDSDGSRTSPQDLVEGVGKGVSLQPQSLYLDQLQKRLGTITAIDPLIVSENNTISVFPNPSTSGVFQLSKVAEWEVYNNVGQKTTTGSSNIVNITDHTKGLYIIKIENQFTKVIFE